MTENEMFHGADYSLSHSIGFDPETDKWLTVHELSREFGGPEEGGWWYDSGEVEVSIPLHDMDEDEVFTLYTLLQKAFPRTHYSSSVAPRGGDWSISFGETRGENFPEERPYYC
jgi:hypothetical protein